MTNKICKYTGAREIPQSVKDNKDLSYQKMQTDICKGCAGDRTNCNYYLSVNEGELKEVLEIPTWTKKQLESRLF